MAIVEVEILEAGYAPDQVLIKDMYFTLDKGKIVGLVGVNGAGKTVTIRAMLGKIPYIQGEMRINERTGQYSYVPEHPTFYEGLTMLEHIELISSINMQCPTDKNERFQSLIAAFDLSASLHQFPTTFSKGMKQKFSLLLGVIKKADLYIFDDPFTCIDMKAKTAFLAYLQQLKQDGAAILIASSAVHLSDNFCDSYLYIHHQTLFLTASNTHLKVKCEHEASEELDCLYHLDMRRNYI